MPLFKPPLYSKMPVSGSAGTSVPCYTFTVEYLSTDRMDTWESMVENTSEITVELLQSLLQAHREEWNRWIELFLVAGSKLFSKTYTPEQLHRISRHVLRPLSSTAVAEQAPSTVQFTPVEIKIYGGQLYVHWEATYQPIVIELPEEPTPRAPATAATAATSTPSASVLPEELEEVDVADLPTSSVTDSDLQAMNAVQQYDKQRIKGTRLKAKLAMYRMQHYMKQYYEKYGKEYSDSESESEWETEEEAYEDEDDEDDDAVQL